MPTRASLHESLLELRPRLRGALELLQDGCRDAYASIIAERRQDRDFHASPQQQSSYESLTAGVVLRLQDGPRIHERATDDWDGAKLERAARDLARDVAAARSRRAAPSYRPPAWRERLEVDLDEEIRSQIPPEPAPSTPVHLGVLHDGAQMPEAKQGWTLVAERLERRVAS